MAWTNHRTHARRGVGTGPSVPQAESPHRVLAVCGLSESFAGCLLAYSQDSGDLRPGPALSPGFSDPFGKLQVALSDGMHRITDGSQIFDVGIGGGKCSGIDAVEPFLSLCQRLFELFTCSRHQVHLK